MHLPSTDNQRRKTIAALVDYLDHSGAWYEGRLRAGFEAACTQLDLNLLIIVGRPLEHPNPPIAANNALYDLVSPACVDGIILTSGLSDPSAVERLARHYQQSLPVCRIGNPISGVPCFLVDQRPGMMGLMEHLLSEHGCRRIAFLGGPTHAPDAILRLEVYRESLNRHGLPFDPALVTEGDFYYHSAAAGVAGILDRGGKFDAVVAANDLMAFGAIRELNRRGLRVPQDVLVTGFDDVSRARIANPPLSTVRQPLEEMARQAIHSMAALWQGQCVSECQQLPAYFIPRKSCGCADAMSAEMAPKVPLSGLTPLEMVRAHQEWLVQRLSDSVHVPPEIGPGWAHKIVEALRAELEGQRESFTLALDALVEPVADRDEIFEELQNAVTLLRSQLGGKELEDVWHQARRALAIANTRAQANRRLESEMALLDLLNSGERFSVALDVPSLARALREELPRLGIHTASVARFQGPAELETILCMRDGTPFEPTPPLFPATQLIAPGVYDQARRHTSVVFAVTSEVEAVGVAVLEFASSSSASEILKNLIGVALRNEAFHREIVNQAALHERSVQERQATANRIEALNLLAAGVAHDLNNALGPLVVLPDTILQEMLRTNGGDWENNAEIRADLGEIKASALRASHTINDLVTLGPGMRTDKQPTDLNNVVTATLQSAAVRSVERQNPDLRLILALSQEALVVNASEVHLSRAVTNLIHNSVEAIDGAGSIVVATARSSLRENLAGYEHIIPGEYAVVTVTDTGRGIASHDIGRVFEPFFSKKTGRGPRSTGLGLAIVYAVMKDHAGFIDLESPHGKGTMVTLYVPLSHALPRATEASVEVTSGTGRILVVDDDPMQLRIARRILTKLGYQVDTMQSGIQAYEFFSCIVASSGTRGAEPPQQRPDLVIFDMILNEDRDGLEVFEQIRQLFPEQRGLVVSGHAPTARSQRAVEKGLIWLAKPYTVEALTRAIQTALASPVALVSTDGY